MAYRLSVAEWWGSHVKDRASTGAWRPTKEACPCQRMRAYVIRSGPGKYLIVFVSFGHKQELYGQGRKFWGPVFHELAAQRRSEILEGHMGQAHVPLLIRIPPPSSGAEVGGDSKGKSALLGPVRWAAANATAMAKPSGREARRYSRNQAQLEAQGRDEDGDF